MNHAPPPSLLPPLPNPAPLDGGTPQEIQVESRDCVVFSRRLGCIPLKFDGVTRIFNRVTRTFDQVT